VVKKFGEVERGHDIDRSSSPREVAHVEELTVGVVHGQDAETRRTGDARFISRIKGIEFLDCYRVGHMIEVSDLDALGQSRLEATHQYNITAKSKGSPTVPEL
jgi:hypothetical protein